MCELLSIQRHQLFKEVSNYINDSFFPMHVSNDSIIFLVLFVFVQVYVCVADKLLMRSNREGKTEANEGVS